ncbi:MAG: outer membrane beta-barrel protein [Gemmatimonadota bacterium]|nr:outer membrane beta-barrel protein [Gemmatimonadota bacterium]
MKLRSIIGRTRTRVLKSLVGIGAAVAMLVPSVSLAQERPVSFEARAGAAVPTFDIADAAKTGWLVGGGVNVPLNDSWGIRAGVDAGFHDAEGAEDVTITTVHYLAGLEYRYLPPASPWMVSANVGAGAMTIDVEDVDSFTYPAINVGGRLGYAISERATVFASAQGDIAFSDEDEVGTSDAWVWPFSVGVEISP